MGAAPGESWEPVHQHQMVRHLSEWMHGWAREDAGAMAVGLDSLPHLAYSVRVMPENSSWPALCQDSPGPLTAEMWSLYASWWFALLASPCSSEVPSLTSPDVLSCPHPESPDLPVFSPTQGFLACFLMTLPASRFQARPSLSLPSQANTSTQHLLLSCEPGCQTFQGPWGPMVTAGREREGHGGSGCVVGDPGGLGGEGSWQ